jgi:3-deoxy-D-manno-octulosonic-acid transferase
VTFDRHGLQAKRVILTLYFKLLLNFYFLLRQPLQGLLWSIQFIPWLRERRLFESKNRYTVFTQTAHRCLEISSQGELEIIRPYLKIWLAAGERLEILYASPSVEREMLELEKLHSHQLRILRLPLLSFKNYSWPFGADDTTLTRWISAPKLYLVRYDFYPELISAALIKGMKLFLINGSLKNKTSKSAFFLFYLKPLYQMMEKVVVPTVRDLQAFSFLPESEAKLAVLETRPLRIYERLANTEAFARKMPGWPILENFIRERSGLRLILGSAWPSDLAILLTRQFELEFQRERSLCFIFPHKLDQASISAMEEQLWTKTPELKLHYLRQGDVRECQKLLADFKQRPGPVMVLVKGILCESYAPFEVAYVGGGFERSIHSLLEPWVSRLRLVCGPKIHRSTEYDMIKEVTPQLLTLVQDSDAWDTLLGEYLKNQSLPQILWPSGYSERELTEKLEQITKVI